MKILIANTLEQKGGAAKATQRILQSLKDKVDINLLVAYKESNKDEIMTNESICFNTLKNLIPKIDAIPKLLYSKDRKRPFSSSLFSFGFRNVVNKFKPDILHLNYTNMGLFSIKDIGNFNIPIVWTLHDAWPFTGGCHLVRDCKNYVNHCGNCPALCSNRDNDLSSYVLSQKVKYWKDRDITIVCPSNWMAENARRSTLFKNNRIEVIPNPIDTTLFKPKDKYECRRELGLDTKKKYVLFGAVDALKDKNKGFKYLRKALEKTDKENVELIVFGSDNQGIELSIPIKYMGYVEDEEKLVSIYSACDVTAVPSKSENLPNVMIESLACGTPVVGFRVGGIPSIIKHDYLGLMVEPYNVEELGEKITTVSNCSRDSIQERHGYVKRNYGYNIVSDKYLRLYRDLLKEKL